MTMDNNVNNTGSKRSTRRSVEIFGVFANHNFYANGLTPKELRTTLEDLGPLCQDWTDYVQSCRHASGKIL
jgi:hypothetical protein